MRERSEPALVEPPQDGNLTDHLLDGEQVAPSDPAVFVPAAGGWRPVTFAEFADDVRRLAKGIIASGVSVGDRVGIMSRNRYEWTLADYALWYAGAVPVPIYETSSAEQVEWILGDSAAVGVFLGSPKNREVFDEVRDSIGDVTRVWTLDDGAVAELQEAGRDVPDSELEQRRSSVTLDDVASIIYTSGTTGPPKGCTLTHRNFMFEVDTVIASGGEVFAPGTSTLLFLPLAHAYGRAIQIACIRRRVHLAHNPDLKDLLADMVSFRPTFLLAVPRVFEKVYNGARAKAIADGRGRIFDLAADTAAEYSRALGTGGPGLLLRLRHALFDRLVYRKLRAAMGGNVEYSLSGGAALGERLGHFFRGVGVTILEGYGMTEATAASTLNRPDAIKMGTVGRPLPGTSVRIADDGEVLMHGPQVFAGYWNNETATRETLDADGWLHSGDIGRLDDDGYLLITGRKKELLVTAAGKNVAPVVLEDRLRAHALVSQCLVVGDGRPFIACLVTLDTEALPAWLRLSGRPADTPVSELVDDPAVTAEIQQAVDDANRAVSHAEAIKKFRILATDWTEESRHMTPSQKLKRELIMTEFTADVEALYA